MVLVGRRHVRSNNSWMHNIRTLTKGRNRCTMQIHPDDADRFGLSDGAPATVTSRVGEVAVDVEITDGIRPGVVSIPHGFGQNRPGVRLRVAQEYRGVNTNVLTDDEFFDPVSGNIALNGVPVTVAPGALTRRAPVRPLADIGADQAKSPAIRRIPSTRSSSPSAKLNRAYPGAPNASPGTNATFACSSTRSASSSVLDAVWPPTSRPSSPVTFGKQ